MVDRNFYNCVLSQVYSPCGELLVCGNSYGDIVVFEVANILNDDEDSYRGPKCRFTSPKKKPICSMCSTAGFCITGTVGSIYGWDWSSIKSGSPKVSWTISLPITSDSLQKIDINSLFVKETETSQLLFAGCGDNKIYVYSLEDGKSIRSFEGHEDYIHSVFNRDWQMASASEDGSVRLWDLRQNCMTNLIQPFREHKASRPHLGKWIGDVSITSDWLICGGGPRLTLWHMRTLDIMTAFSEMTDSGIHVARLHEDCILAGGNDNHFYHLSYTGDVLSKIDTSPCAVYSAAYIDKPYERGDITEELIKLLPADSPSNLVSLAGCLVGEAGNASSPNPRIGTEQEPPSPLPRDRTCSDLSLDSPPFVQSDDPGFADAVSSRSKYTR